MNVLFFINIASPEWWFFSESRLRSMRTLGQRLYFALKRAEKVESENRRAQEVAFLRDTAPKLSTELDLRTSLRENAERQIGRLHIRLFLAWDFVSLVAK
ncbi:MAG: hypothetical protein GY845_31340 [Planctomycetes bacterium]|nr:hypothetical protein [Planctomycetota bacterium]